LGSVEDVDKCCGMPNKSIHFLNLACQVLWGWENRWDLDHTLHLPELLILGLLISNWVNWQFLLHKLGWAHVIG
jgi:hypothetical protein